MSVLRGEHTPRAPRARLLPTAAPYNPFVRTSLLVVCVLAGACLDAVAQPAGLRTRIDGYVAEHQGAIVGELVQLLAVPNVAADTANIRRNATLLAEMLAKRGLASEILETDGNPLVYAARNVPGASRTLLFYAHYDGQPTNSAAWKQATPWTPTLRTGRLENGGSDRETPANGRFDPDWRIYARSASDDKSPIVALCAALDALAASGIAVTSNIRVILDGEEEAGSPSLVPAIARYRDKLRADAMFILDGPVHPSEKPTLVFGARGIATMALTVYGPKMALHSGHYGNWAPNPAMRLAQLLASFKDDQGRVLVEGFYDGITPLAPDEQAMLDAVPDSEPDLMKFFGLAGRESAGRSLQAGLQVPTFNVRGMSSGFVGANARTIVPESATAEIDIRLVKETPSVAMVAKVRAHLEKQGYAVVASDPDDAMRAKHQKLVKMVVHASGSEAYRTSPLLPISVRASEALTAVFGEPPVRVRTTGGTVPIAPFIDALSLPAISVPIVNFDNNQHGENENLRLGHFFRGITTIATLLTM